LLITKDMLDELSVPEHIALELVAKYMEYVTEPKPFVMQAHYIGDSEHVDFRFKVNGYLEGWSIVGASRDDPHTPQKFLENIGKGFRAETKARQPLVWLKVEGKVAPGEIGAGEEAAGEFKILTKGQLLTGAQKPYFHEYFIKDKKYFKDWTRIVIRGIKVAKIDPQTKKPIPGKYERMWRFMVPKTQEPYTISNRAMKENWKPPKECPFPFPKDWAKENFTDQYRKWLQWITKSDEEDIDKLEKLYVKKKNELLSKNIRFTLALTSWFGARAKTGRQMPQFRWYLLLDDKGKGSVRRFFLDGYPLKDEIMGAYEMDRVPRKWLDYDGSTKPDTPFNPNKELVGKYTIIDKGIASYETKRVDGEEVITLKFKGKKLKGEWELRQEEKGADVYTFEKLSQEEGSELATGQFVLDIHEFPEKSGKKHLDLRFHVSGQDFLQEFNLFTTDEIWKYPEEKAVKARLKKCEDLEWMKIKPKGTRMKAYGKWSVVETIDHGDIEIIDESPNFMSFNIRGKKLKGYYIAKRANHLWSFMKSKLPMESPTRTLS